MATFTMPSLGADMEEGTLIEWLVKPGDEVRRGDLMALIDTDKATVEVESFADGVVEQLLVAPGETRAVGAALAIISDAPIGQGQFAAAPAVPAASVTLSEPSYPSAVDGTMSGLPSASPLLRHLATERGIDLARVHGTGAGGRVTRADLDAAVPVSAVPVSAVPVSAAPVSAVPAAFAQGPSGRRRISPLARRMAEEAGLELSAIAGTGRQGTVRAVDVQRAMAAGPVPQTQRPLPPVAPDRDHRASMRQAIAHLMSKANAEIPHYYLSTKVDMNAASTWLRAQNRELPVRERLVPAVLFVKAVAVAAAELDGINGEWRDGRFHRADVVNVGLVTSMRGGGLLVPVLADAAATPVSKLMADLRGAVTRVRAGHLRSSELIGGTITLTNLGDQGVESVYGVIFPPQVALVGMGAVVERPWAVDGVVRVRPVVTVTLAADHRASDGAVGARFLTRVDALLQKPGEL